MILCPDCAYVTSGDCGKHGPKVYPVTAQAAPGAGGEPPAAILGMANTTNLERRALDLAHEFERENADLRARLQAVEADLRRTHDSEIAWNERWQRAHDRAERLHAQATALAAALELARRHIAIQSPLSRNELALLAGIDQALAAARAQP